MLALDVLKTTSTKYCTPVLGIGYPDPYLGGRPDRYLIWARDGQTDTWILALRPDGYLAFLGR
jgi:hypothetical protein